MVGTIRAGEVYLALTLVENGFVKRNSNGKRIRVCNGYFDDATSKQCVGRRCLRVNQEVELSDSIKILIEKRRSIR